MMRFRAPARILRTIVFCFCVIGAWVASPAQTASAPQGGNTGATYRIAGTIVNKLDGSPLGRARVVVRDVKDARKFEWVITAEGGKFQFTDVPAGKYSLTGAKRGFITGSYDQHDVFSTAIVTGAGIDTENLVLKILPNAMISGRVLDEAGEPVRNAQVNLYLDDHAQGIKEIHMVRRSMTDDLGAYELTRLGAGTYYLAASGRPWYAVHPPAEPLGANGQKNPSAESGDRSLDVAYPVTYYADVTDSDDATPISIQGGDHVQLDVHLNPVPALHLVFHLADGRNGVWLEQTAFDSSTYLQTGPAQTSPGVWEITGVPAGRYNLHIQGTGSSPSLEMKGVELTRDGEEIDTSGAQALSTLKISVEAAGGAPPPQGIGVALRAGGTHIRFQPVDRKGVAEIDQLPAGSYEVMVAGPGKVYSIAKISAEGTEISGRTINVAAGSSPALSLMLMGESTELEGTVKQAGKPFAGAMVVLVPRNPRENRSLFRRDQTDLDGTFALHDVSPGIYTVLAIENGWDLNWGEPDVIGTYLRHGQRVDVGNQTRHPMKLADIEVQSR